MKPSKVTSRFQSELWAIEGHVETRDLWRQTLCALGEGNPRLNVTTCLPPGISAIYKNSNDNIFGALEHGQKQLGDWGYGKDLPDLVFYLSEAQVIRQRVLPLNASASVSATSELMMIVLEMFSVDCQSEYGMIFWDFTLSLITYIDSKSNYVSTSDHRNGGTVNAEDAAENGAEEEEETEKEEEEEANAHPGCQLVVGHFSSVQWLQLTNVDSGDNVDKLQVQAIDID
ncbi:hypothetical protein ACLKA6_017868 [Drosophila palustris]